MMWTLMILIMGWHGLKPVPLARFDTYERCKEEQAARNADNKRKSPDDIDRYICSKEQHDE